MEIAPHHTDWIFILLSVVAILVLIARAVDVNRFNTIIRLPLSNIGKGVSKNFNPLEINRLQDVFLGIAGSLSFSLTAYFLQHKAGENYMILGFFRLFVLINSVFLFKIFISATAGWLFNKVHQISEIQNVGLAFLTCISILFIPFLWLAFYAPFPPLAGRILLSVIGVVGVLVVLTFTGNVWWKMPVSTSYKILYLCTLEIAPLLVLAKWLI